MGFMSTTHFFLPLRGAGRWRRAAQEIHSTAGGARAKAAGKAAPAQNRRGSSCWSRKSRCCGLGTLRDCSLAAASVACSALALTNAALAKPTATVALVNPAIVIAASVASQSASPSLPPPSPSRRHLATTIAIGIALAATAYATLSLAVAVAAFAFAFAFAVAAQPAQSASAALAALATVEGRGASLIRSRLIETVRSVCGTSWFSRRFCLKAPQKRPFFLAGLPPRTPRWANLAPFHYTSCFRCTFWEHDCTANMNEQGSPKVRV